MSPSSSSSTTTTAATTATAATTSSGNSSDWWGWFTKLQDDQRLERLQHCRELENVLQQCEGQHEYNPNTMEEFSGGLRRMKYFGWRGVLTNHEHMPEKLRHAIATSCARERHAVWACRAVAVGCGKELGVLKACFDEQGSFAVLHQAQTAYEPLGENVSPTSIPCAQQQAALGSSVRRQAHELLLRQQQRQSNDAAQQ